MFLKHPSPLWITTFLVVAVLLGACASGDETTSHSQPTVILDTSTATSPAPTNTPIPPTVTSTPLPPTATPSQTPTPTLTDTPTPTQTPTETPIPATPSGEDAIYVYYIQLDTGGPVSCGDSLIPANTGVWRTGDTERDVRTALKRLFFKREFIGSLYNPIFRSNMDVQSVEIKKFDGSALVNLAGTYVRSDDRCDDSRVRAQVWSTIRQFPEVKTVKVLLNGNLLGDILATGK